MSCLPTLTVDFIFFSIYGIHLSICLIFFYLQIKSFSNGFSWSLTFFPIDQPNQWSSIKCSFINISRPSLAATLVQVEKSSQIYPTSKEICPVWGCLFSLCASFVNHLMDAIAIFLSINVDSHCPFPTASSWFPPPSLILHLISISFSSLLHCSGVPHQPQAESLRKQLNPFAVNQGVSYPVYIICSSQELLSTLYFRQDVSDLKNRQK